MVQIRFDNLCGPLVGPLLSLGIGFRFRRRGPAREPLGRMVLKRRPCQPCGAGRFNDPKGGDCAVLGDNC